MIKVSIITLLLALATSVGAQNIVRSLEADRAGQGRVRLFQDARIEALIGAQRQFDGEQITIQVAGYRVQAYAGNNTRQARNDAQNIAASIREKFPELPVYTSFVPPRWLCRVGDFRTLEEADEIMRHLRATGKFKEVSIVKDQINITF